MTAPVHGGVFGADMINRYVSALRVIVFDETTGKAVKRFIYDEEELRRWRCGFGFLGVITAVEFSGLVKREEFIIQHISETITWNETNFNALVAQSQVDHVYSEFFIDARSSLPSTDPTGEAKIHQVVFDTTGPLTRNCGLAAKWWYKQRYASLMKKWGPDGDQPLGKIGDEIISFVNKLLEDATAADPAAANGKFSAGANIDLSAFGYGLYAMECATGVNDGFWVKGTPCASIFAYFCPITYAFEFMDTYRKVFLDRWNETDDPLRNRFNQMAEFRLVWIQEDGPVLFNLPAGVYIISEVLTLNGYTPLYVKEAFHEMEQEWNNIPYTGGTNPAKVLAPSLIHELEDGSKVVRVFPHVSKNWAYGEVAPGSGSVPPSYEPFDEKLMALVQYGCFTEAERQAFHTLRETRDPNDVFLCPQSSWLIQPEAPA